MKTVSCLAALGVMLAASSALAADVTGKYGYQEKGYTGSMVIKSQGPGFVFTFKTKSTSNGQMCDFTTFETPVDEGGGRDDDAKPAHGGTKDDGIKFAIKFSGNTATIDVDSKGSECGMSGYFGGKYVKAK